MKKILRCLHAACFVVAQLCTTVSAETLFEDDFEAPGWDGSNWDFTRGTPGTDFGTEPAPGGGSGNAGFLDHGGYSASATLSKQIGYDVFSHVDPAATATKATIRFYDANPAVAPWFHVASQPLVNGGGNLTAGFGYGSNLGHYYFGSGVYSATAARSAGWHTMEVYYTDAGAWPVIDGVDYSNPNNILGGSASAMDTDASSKLHAQAGFYPTSQTNHRTHFDDVVVEDITPPAGLVAHYDWEGHVAPSTTQALIDKALPGRSDLFVRKGSPQAVPFRGGTGGQFDRTGTGTDLGGSIAQDNPELHVTGPLTLSAWIQPTEEAVDATASSGAYVITRYGGGGAVGDQRAYALGLVNGGLNFVISPDGTYGSALDLVSPPGMLQAGTPYHLTAVFEPGVRQEVYLNGVRVKDQGTSTVPSQIFDSSAWFRIGCMFGGWFGGAGDVNHFDGIIDDVRVHNRALAPQEVVELSGFVPEPGLVAHYDWDQPSAPTTTVPLMDKAGPEGALLYVRVGAPQLVPFRDGMGGLFNRTDSGVNTGDSIAYDSPELHVTGPITLAAWIQPTQEAIDAGGANVITKYGGGAAVGNQRGYSLGLFQGGLNFIISEDGTYGGALDMYTSPNIKLEADKAYHLVGVFEPGVRQEIYLNGVRVMGQTGSSVPNAIHDSTAWFRLGCVFWDAGGVGDINHFDGIIGDVRVYNRDLAAQEVTNLSGFVTPNLVAQYDWEQGLAPTTSTPLLDKAGPDASFLYVRKGSPQVVPFRDGRGGQFDRTGTGTDLGDSIAYDSPELHVTGPLTLMAWIEPTQEAVDATASSGAYVVTKYGGGGAVGDQRAYALGLVDGGLNFVISPDGTYGAAADLLSDPDLLEADRAYHIAGVFDPGQRMTVFLDGQIVASLSAAAGDYVPDEIFDSTAWFRIGCMFGGWFGGAGDVNHFDGIIDDVRVYDRALTQLEIFKAAGLPVPEPSTIVLLLLGLLGLGLAGWRRRRGSAKRR